MDTIFRVILAEDNRSFLKLSVETVMRTELAPSINLHSQTLALVNGRNFERQRAAITGECTDSLHFQNRRTPGAGQPKE